MYNCLYSLGLEDPITDGANLFFDKLDPSGIGLEFKLVDDKIKIWPYLNENIQKHSPNDIFFRDPNTNELRTFQEVKDRHVILPKKQIAFEFLKLIDDIAFDLHGGRFDKLIDQYILSCGTKLFESEEARRILIDNGGIGFIFDYYNSKKPQSFYDDDLNDIVIALKECDTEEELFERINTPEQKKRLSTLVVGASQLHKCDPEIILKKLLAGEININYKLQYQ